MKKSLLICILAVMLCVSMLFAACAPSLEAETLESMKELLYQMYKDSNPANTYEVVSLVASAGERANVQWSVNVTAGNTNDVKLGKNENNKQTIEIEPYPAQDVAYTLTATLVNEKGKAYEIDGEPVSISFERSLTKFVLNTYEEYLAACQANNGSGSGEQIRIKGYVIGVVCMESSSKGSLYIQDADGHGYYAYAPVDATEGCETTEQLRAKWPIGTEVVVTGTVTTYNGQYEFNKDCTLIVTGNTATEAQLPYVDATAAFAAAESNQDTALAAYQNRRVTLKDATITSVDITLNADGTYNKVYYYFTLPGSDVEFNVYYTIYFINEATMLELHDKLEVGTKVDLSGVISVYSKAFQIYPDTANSVSNIREITYTDAEKIAMAKDNLTLVDVAVAGDEIQLPAEGVLGTTITWALDGTYTNAAIADGKLTVTEQLAETVVLNVVATITSGSASENVTFQVTVPAARTSFVKAALNAGAALEDGSTTTDSYLIIGTIDEITTAYSEQYGNVSFNVIDAEGNKLLIYRYNLEDAATVKAGDFVAFAAPIKNYKGTIEAVATFVKLDITTLADAAAAGLAETGVAGTQVYGFVKSIDSAYSEQYGNISVTISDGTNDFYIYRLKGGADIQIGDYLLITGTPSQYKGAAQMAAGATFVKSPLYVAPAPAHTCESKCPTCQGCLDAACTETACATKCEGHEGGEQGGESGGEVNPPVGETTTVSNTIAGVATANSWANSTAYSSFTLDGNITVSATGTAVGSYSLNTGKFYTNGNNWRLYQSENATLTITAANGATIVSVKVTYEGYNTGSLTLAGANVASEQVVTVNATSVTFGVGNTGTATNGQARITAIEVVYAGGTTGGESGGEVNPPAHTCESVCPTCNKCTDTACTETACADKCEGHEPAEKITTIAGALAGKEGDQAELTGTVTEIYQAWNPQYNNVSFYISDGTSRILVFRTGTNAGIGDVVKVVGTVTIYEATGVAQIAQGSTTTILTAHECTEFTPADCLNAAVCTVCGETSGEALGHTEANGEGKCDRCGADVGSATQQITAKKTMAELITALGWTSSTTKQSFNLDDKVSVKINGGNNTGKAYNGDHIRIYATDSPAGTITISVPEGYELVSVKISTQTGTYAYLQISGNSTTDLSNTVVSVSGQSVVFNSVKNGSDGKQVRVTAIEVVYAAVAQ